MGFNDVMASLRRLYSLLKSVTQRSTELSQDYRKTSQGTRRSRSFTLVIIRICWRAFIVHEVIRRQRRRNTPELDRRLGEVETVGEIIDGRVRLA